MSRQTEEYQQKLDGNDDNLMGCLRNPTDEAKEPPRDKIILQTTEREHMATASHDLLHAIKKVPLEVSAQNYQI